MAVSRKQVRSIVVISAKGRFTATVRPTNWTRRSSTKPPRGTCDSS